MKRLTYRAFGIYNLIKSIFPVRDTLNEQEVEWGLKYVLWDGLASQAMVTLTGGIFLVAFALELGASNTVIGLLAAIPPLAELFQIPSIYLVEKIRIRRFLVVVNSFIARTFWVVIAAIPFIFTADMAIAILIILMICYAVFSSISHCNWNSWMHDLIPEERLGSFFSNRMRLSTALALVLSLAAAVFIDLWKDEMGQGLIYGYSVIFFTGYIAGMLGVFFLSKTPEPKMAPAVEHKFLETLGAPLHDANYRNLLAFLSSWNFAVNLAAPFFTVYMLKRLDMDITMVIALSVLSQLVSVSFYRIWGRTADRFSNKSVLRVSGPMFMICILGWTFTTLPDVHILTMPLLIAIHTFTGISTAGVTLASGNIGLKLAPRGKATSYLASSIVVNSLAAGIAPIVGGLFADYFAARELSLMLIWKSPASTLAFETLDLQQWDFFFFFAFIIGLYSLHRLSLVEETGWVKERIFMQELFTEVKREMRNLSTAGGIRTILGFPFSRLK